MSLRVVVSGTIIILLSLISSSRCESDHDYTMAIIEETAMTISDNFGDGKARTSEVNEVCDMLLDASLHFGEVHFCSLSKITKAKAKMLAKKSDAILDMISKGSNLGDLVKAISGIMRSTGRMQKNRADKYLQEEGLTHNPDINKLICKRRQAAPCNFASSRKGMRIYAKEGLDGVENYSENIFYNLFTSHQDKTTNLLETIQDWFATADYERIASKFKEHTDQPITSTAAVIIALATYAIIATRSSIWAAAVTVGSFAGLPVLPLMGAAAAVRKQAFDTRSLSMTFMAVSLGYYTLFSDTAEAMVILKTGLIISLCIALASGAKENLDIKAILIVVLAAVFTYSAYESQDRGNAVYKFISQAFDITSGVVGKASNQASHTFTQAADTVSTTTKYVIYGKDKTWYDKIYDDFLTHAMAFSVLAATAALIFMATCERMGDRVLNEAMSFYSTKEAREKGLPFTMRWTFSTIVAPFQNIVFALMALGAVTSGFTSSTSVWANVGIIASATAVAYSTFATFIYSDYVTKGRDAGMAPNRTNKDMTVKFGQMRKSDLFGKIVVLSSFMVGIASFLLAARTGSLPALVISLAAIFLMNYKTEYVEIILSVVYAAVTLAWIPTIGAGIVALCLLAYNVHIFNVNMTNTGESERAVGIEAVQEE